MRAVLFCISICANIVLAMALYEWLSSFLPRWLAFPIGIIVGFIAHAFLNIKFINPRTPQNTPILAISETALSISYPDGKIDSLDIKSISKVEIITSDGGPFEEDLWWLFYAVDRDEPLSVPEGAIGSQVIFKLLEESFTNVNMEQIQKALGSTSNARFAVWASS